tara:strand:+ start:3440 stop:5686 length:2247 start_codon:yes stop_codon:yes gene_type:complete
MAKKDNYEYEKDSKKEYGEDTYDSSKYKDHDYIINLLSASQEADQDLRDNGREAALFVDKRDGQWEPYWYSNAGESKSPRYSFDMVNPIIDQVCSEIEQASFDVNVSPAGGNSTKDISNTYSGIVRNIESMSDAKEVYSHSARSMVTSGFGAWRVVHKYVSQDSFDQDLFIEPIGNALDRVWFDPAAEKQDKSDSRYCFVLHAIGKDEYDRRWPEASGQSVDEGRDGEAYYDKAEVVVVGELLYCEEKERELVMMSNGQVHEVNDEFKKISDELKAIGVTETRRRKRVKKEVCSRLFDASDWLEAKKKTVFNMIPVVPIYANYKIFENKTIFWGLVEKLMDSQRVLNYSVSREVAETSLAPRSKYWMTMGQAAGHESSLQTLNTNHDPVQFFNVDPEFPQVPQQQGGAQINPALRTMSEAMRGMITYASGMFSSNMGDNPQNQSGVAINALQNKGDNSTIKYFKALEFGIRATGRILVAAIPEIYDSARTVRLLKEDNTYDVADINQKVIDQQTGDVVTVNDLSVGNYDVQVKAGASFKNRQQETIETIIEIAKVDPTILQIAGDVLLDNVATASAQQISDRKRAQMIVAGLIPQDQMTEEEVMEAQQQPTDQQQDPNMVLAQAEQMKAQAEMLRAQIEQARLQNEQMKLQLEAQKLQTQMQGDQADNQIDSFNAETKRMETQIKAQEAGATIDRTSAQAMGEELDNQEKMADMMDRQRAEAERMRAEAQRKAMRFMSDSEIARMQNG